MFLLDALQFLLDTLQPVLVGGELVGDLAQLVLRGRQHVLRRRGVLQALPGPWLQHGELLLGEPQQVVGPGAQLPVGRSKVPAAQLPQPCVDDFALRLEPVQLLRQPFQPPKLVGLLPQLLVLREAAAQLLLPLHEAFQSRPLRRHPLGRRGEFVHHVTGALCHTLARPGLRQQFGQCLGRQVTGVGQCVVQREQGLQSVGPVGVVRTAAIGWGVQPAEGVCGPPGGGSQYVEGRFPVGAP